MVHVYGQSLASDVALAETEFRKRLGEAMKYDCKDLEIEVFCTEPNLTTVGVAKTYQISFRLPYEVANSPEIYEWGLHTGTVLGVPPQPTLPPELRS